MAVTALFPGRSSDAYPHPPEQNVPTYLWELGKRLRIGLIIRQQEHAGIPFVAVVLIPMTALETLLMPQLPPQQIRRLFNQTQPRLGPRTPGSIALGIISLQEMAVRVVLLRRGGLNFLDLSHTQHSIDESSHWRLPRMFSHATEQNHWDISVRLARGHSQTQV